MANRLQHLRGSEAEHSTFTGAKGEISLVTDTSANRIPTGEVRVHDGTTAGGLPLTLGTTSKPLTNNIVLGSGVGINFNNYGSEDSNSATTVGSNLLDDYEEGTYTLTLHDANSGGNQSDYSATASYVKIGNMVTVTLNATLTFTDYSGSPSDLTSTNALYWSLPFTPSSTKRASGSIITSSVSFRNGADACLNPIHVESASRGRFRAYSSGDASAFLRPTDFNGGSIQHLTMTYFTD